jgi:hypothetical protein
MACIDQNDTYLTPGDIAHMLQVHSSAPVRWFRRGTLLADGSRLYLKHLRLPGGFRVKQEWLDTFLEALAKGKSNNSPTSAKPATSPHQAQVRSELQAAGLL